MDSEKRKIIPKIHSSIIENYKKMFQKMYERIDKLPSYEKILEQLDYVNKNFPKFNEENMLTKEHMKVKIILIVHILKRTSAVPPSGILSDENIYFALEKLYGENVYERYKDCKEYTDEINKDGYINPIEIIYEAPYKKFIIEAKDQISLASICLLIDYIIERLKITTIRNPAKIIYIFVYILEKDENKIYTTEHERFIIKNILYELISDIIYKHPDLWLKYFFDRLNKILPSLFKNKKLLDKIGYVFSNRKDYIEELHDTDYKNIISEHKLEEKRKIEKY